MSQRSTALCEAPTQRPGREVEAKRSARVDLELAIPLTSRPGRKPGLRRRWRSSSVLCTAQSRPSDDSRRIVRSASRARAAGPRSCSPAPAWARRRPDRRSSRRAASTARRRRSRLASRSPGILIRSVGRRSRTSIPAGSGAMLATRRPRRRVGCQLGRYTHCKKRADAAAPRVWTTLPIEPRSGTHAARAPRLVNRARSRQRAAAPAEPRASRHPAARPADPRRRTRRRRQCRGRPRW